MEGIFLATRRHSKVNRTDKNGTEQKSHSRQNVQKFCRKVKRPKTNARDHVARSCGKFNKTELSISEKFQPG